MAQEGTFSPSAMIRLGPHWHMRWAGIVNWWLQHTILLHIVRLSCMAQLIIIILAQLYLELSQFGGS